MKEKKVLYSGEEVRAVLDGRKTQKRLIIKPRWFDHAPQFVSADTVAFEFYQADGAWREMYVANKIGTLAPKSWRRICPYMPGDRLWVREAWRYDDWTEDGDPFVVYAADGERRGPIADIPDEWQDRVADTFAALSVDYKRKGRACDEKWRPSIVMPRWASRITLEVVSVRVERVQEITQADCLAEGIEPVVADVGRVGTDYDTYRPLFRKLWDSKNANRKDKDGKMLPYAWENSPWVWVLEFRRITENEVTK